MSQENVEVVRRLVEAFYLRDGETVASVLDAEIEFESALVEHRTYVGMAGMLEYRRDLDDAWAEWRSEGDQYLSAGSDRVVHLYRIVGTGKGSGVPVAQDIAILWTLRAGRVIQGKVFLDQAEALKAAGLKR